MRLIKSACLAIAIIANATLPIWAAQTNVAVAANFTAAAKDIAAAFKTKTGYDAVLSFGASGQFYTQITEGAPFEVFLSADEARPKKLADDGVGLANTRFTYAIGKLVLWSKTFGAVKNETTLKEAAFNKLAIANPASAPYGAAALETIKALGLTDALQPKIVQGNSIAQSFEFVNTGNAELGFLALSQLTDVAEGSRWLVPQNLYSPIKQDAILLKKGEENEATKAFVAFLKSEEAKAIIIKYGYDTAN